MASKKAELVVGVAETLATAGVTAASVIERMKKATGLKTDAALAMYLQTAPANISKWRKRNAIPFAEAVFVSIKTGSPTSFIISGKERSSSAPVEALPLDIKVLRAVLASLWRLSAFSLPPNEDVAIQLDYLAKAIATRYFQAEALFEKLTREQKLDHQIAMQAVVGALELLFSDGHFFDEINRRL